jgi:predicted DNA-binding transcriptional regulator YafY
MESLSVSKQTWQSHLLTYEDYFKDSFGTNRDPQVSKAQTITLRFAPKVASLIYDMKWHHSEKKTKTEKGGLDLSMIVKVEMDLVRWVVSFGKDVSIVEGEELRNAVKSYLNEALLQYDNT